MNCNYKEISSFKRIFEKLCLHDRVLCFNYLKSLKQWAVHPRKHFSLMPGRIFCVEPVLFRELCVLPNDTLQCRRWCSKMQPIDLKSSTLPLYSQPVHSNPSANCYVCRLIIIFANGMDPDQVGQNVGPRIYIV